MNRTYSFLLTGLSVVLFIYCYFVFKKWNAEWYGLNVTILSIIIAPIIGIGMKMIFIHFIDEDFFFSYAGFGGLAFGSILCIILGCWLTEPTLQKGWNEDKPVSEGYRHSRVGSYYYSSTYFVNSNESSSSSSSSDTDGEGLAYLVLILVVVILILLSAILPHFWIIGSLSILTIMILFLIQNEKDYLK